MTYDDLQSVLELSLLKVQRELSGLAQEEAAVRGKIAKIQEDLASDRAQLPEHREHRAIGADLAWAQWANKALRGLNIELAQIRARKEPILQAHRKAIGKVEVAKSIASLQKQAALDMKKKRALSEVTEHAALSHLLFGGQ